MPVQPTVNRARGSKPCTPLSPIITQIEALAIQVPNDEEFNTVRGIAQETPGVDAAVT